MILFCTFCFTNEYIMYVGRLRLPLKCVGHARTWWKLTLFYTNCRRKSCLEYSWLNRGSTTAWLLAIILYKRSEDIPMWVSLTSTNGWNLCSQQLRIFCMMEYYEYEWSIRICEYWRKPTNYPLCLQLLKVV